MCTCTCAQLASQGQREKKTREAGQRTGVLEMMSDIVQNEGFGSMFAGSTPRSLRALIDGAVQFVAYESTLNYLHTLDWTWTS
mmetsp:Transcript_39903/g.40694  ORF Transcript_39903/g.40694 Transcript_39903/m.40694 type:complete len:83 (-) Transcript_39903:179-427(-)